MGYLLTEIVWYLVIAGVIGFVVGFLVKGELQKKVVNDVEKRSSEETETETINVNSTEVAKVPVEKTEELNEAIKVDTVEHEIEEKVVEVKADDLEDSETNNTVPTLLSEAKKEGKDKLSMIKGIGPVLENKLNALGVYHFEQIASWTKAQEEWIGAQMSFPKRVSKEEWVKQAKELMEKA